LTTDREDNVWIALPGGNQLTTVNSHTGKVDHVALTSVTPEDFDVTPKDREISASSGMTPNTATPLEKGPPRIAADRDTDTVWVCEFFADRIAKVDVASKKVTEYSLPHRYSQPYAITVGKNHDVWITMLNSDRIAKFDPGTEKFTEYELPTRGT